MLGVCTSVVPPAAHLASLTSLLLPRLLTTPTFPAAGNCHLLSCRFYQHLPQGCEWAFGLVWGHSISTDLVHWQRLPHAIVPTPDTFDADGCFSGCATIDTDGTPVLLYTGVRPSNSSPLEAPPLERNLQLPFIEAQLYATPTNPGALLRLWVLRATAVVVTASSLRVLHDGCPHQHTTDR